MVPQNYPFAALSRTFRALWRPSKIGTGKCCHAFVCTRGLHEDCIGNNTFNSNEEVEAFA